MASLTWTRALPGELRKASSAVTTSSWSTLVAVNALVHEMFPPVAAVLPADTQASSTLMMPIS